MLFVVGAAALCIAIITRADHAPLAKDLEASEGLGVRHCHPSPKSSILASFHHSAYQSLVLGEGEHCGIQLVLTQVPDFAKFREGGHDGLITPFCKRRPETLHQSRYLRVIGETGSNMVSVGRVFEESDQGAHVTYVLRPFHRRFCHLLHYVPQRMAPPSDA